MLTKLFKSIAILLLSVHCCGAVPVVGILSQPKTSGNETYHYIAASYVKWIESSGAIAIPIPYDADETLTREIFSQINGVLFPGGDALLPLSASVMWELALESNKRGEYFPLWGTCLGFGKFLPILTQLLIIIFVYGLIGTSLLHLASQSEFLIELAGGKNVLQTGFNAENVSLPLILSTEHKSQLYQEEYIQNIVSTKNITMNNHRNGITPSHFGGNARLTTMFRATSTSIDLDGNPFVSTIESSMNYPIFGVQYHPEKNTFEYGLQPGTSIPYEAIDHTEEAIHLSLHLAMFFGSCLRKSSVGEYTLVNRHCPITEYPIVKGVTFEQIYIIPHASQWETSESLEDSHDFPEFGLRGSTSNR